MQVTRALMTSWPRSWQKKRNVRSNRRTIYVTLRKRLKRTRKIRRRRTRISTRRRRRKISEHVYLEIPERKR